MAHIIENVVQFKSGHALELEQVKSICTGAGGARATDSQIREYLKDEGWQQDAIDEFIEFINEGDNLFSLILRMRNAAETQDLAELYEEQVDNNLFNEKQITIVTPLVYSLIWMKQICIHHRSH
jgi:hypothetical protein